MAAKGERPSVFEYDPAHPVPSIGGQMNDSVGPNFPADGPRDQVCSVKTFGCDNELPLASRRDVRVFQTPPLAADVVIAGPVSVDLWISSSAPDTDFTAKLVDVAPPSKDYPFGFAMNIEDRIIRVRWSEGYDKPVPLKAGEVRKVTVDLIAAGNRFAKGHRIRVDISSSNFPYFDANPNTGERVGIFNAYGKGGECGVPRWRTSVSVEFDGFAGDVDGEINKPHTRRKRVGLPGFRSRIVG